MLHAPRQTGKTSALIALRDLLNSGDDYRCVDVNVEGGQVARDDVAEGVHSIALCGVRDISMRGASPSRSPAEGSRDYRRHKRT